MRHPDPLALMKVRAGQTRTAAIDRIADAVAERIAAQQAGGRQLTARETGTLIGAFLDRNPNTAKRYGEVLEKFRAFVTAETVLQAVQMLFSLDPGKMNMLVEKFIRMLGKRHSSATVNNSLSALKSLAKTARRYGYTAALIEVQRVRSEPRRDTRGPATEKIEAVIRSLSASHRRKQVRDRLLLGLLYYCALRANEPLTIRWPEDVDLDRGEVRISAKCRKERQTILLPARVQGFLKAWLGKRGKEPGPLFNQRSDTAAVLDRQAVYRMVRGYGLIRPHGLRHTAITRILDLTENIRLANKFARHTALSVTMVYDDRRHELSGDAARMLAGELLPPEKANGEKGGRHG